MIRSSCPDICPPIVPPIRGERVKGDKRIPVVECRRNGSGRLAAGDVPAEWVEIIRPVDMHARPEQSSETVKVVEKGLKLRVGARDKNWVQVSDPATSANGWIYSRFLKPTPPPAQ